LSETLAQLDQKTIKEQIASHVPGDAQKILAAAGVRDEHVFPVPAIIEKKPSLVGYYRLLLGSPQKGFYASSTGMGRFKRMEERNMVDRNQGALISDFCRAMAQPLAELVRQIPAISKRDLQELQLLTLGSKFQGANNTMIGKAAMQGIFVAIEAIVGKYVAEKKDKKLVLKNASNRTVVITLSHDPDVSVQELMDDSAPHNKVAIELKGGTDVSNAHNRAGEAEKSHLKAKRKGFKDYWTIISKKGLEMSKLHGESQTTTEWFDVTELLAQKGPEWENFRQKLSLAVGIPVADV
jgi:XcyI restriction endonuclease